MSKSNIIEILEKTLEQFTRNFIENPYLAYTEHGMHALFFNDLFNSLSEEQRYTNFNNHKVCVIQKEYCTAGKLCKPKRQHWDIALLKPHVKNSNYDYMKLAAVVEFGLNESIDHLIDDYLRVTHPEANIEHSYIIHLYRLSKAGNKISSRDASNKYFEINNIQNSNYRELIKLLEEMSIGNGSFHDLIKSKMTERNQSEEKPVTIYLGVTDNSDENKTKVLLR